MSVSICRLHGIVVGDSKEDYYRNTVQDHLNELGLHDVSVDDVISLYFNYVIPEYGMNIPCQLGNLLILLLE